MEKTKYTGKFIRVTEEEMEGRTWERAYFNDGVLVFAINEEGKFLMIEEKRPHEEKKVRLKFVTGNLDESEDPAEAANRELQEEVGYKAENLVEILNLNSSGTINNTFRMYVGTDLIESKLPKPDGEDTILSIKFYTLEEIFNFLENGELAWNLVTLGLFKIKSLKEAGKLNF